MNVRENTYKAIALLQDGSTIVLNPAIQQMGWQDPTDEVAQRATISLAQTKTPKGWLNSLLPLCTYIQIEGNEKVVFEGIAWDWEHESSDSREISLVCYDRFIYAQNSKTFAYFAAGKTTKDIITQICTDNGIECDYQWDSATHDRIVFRGTYISDQILEVLQSAQKLLGKRPVATFEGNRLVVRGEGYNDKIYFFEAAESVLGTSERMTMDGLVTQVAIYGAEDKEDRRKLEAVVPGKTEYGVLQDVVLMTSSTTMDQANAEAEGILKDKGKPQFSGTIETPDVPEIRKGWKIRVEADGYSGYYIVRGVTHNAESRTMVMDLWPVQE